MKRTLNTDDLKLIELSLLDALDRFCSEHDLRYYLTYGTLIGAIRHKGFIPWDDDIDVIMPRTDYELLIRTFNSEYADPSVRVLAHELDKAYYLPIAKLVDTTTVLKENVDNDYEIGVYLDIFPLDNLSDDLAQARSMVKKGFRYNELLMMKTIVWREGRSLAKNIALVLGKLLLSFQPISGILEKLDTYCWQNQSRSFSKYVGVMCGISAGDASRVFEREWFERTMPVEFEGKLYPAPTGADALLRQLYGDYMQLPPENQRASHHSFTAWRKSERLNGSTKPGREETEGTHAEIEHGQE